MKPLYIAIFAICGLILVGVGIYYYSGKVTADDVARQAISGGTAEKRIEAINSLCLFDQNTATPLLRRVAQQSKDADVRAKAIERLSYYNDNELLLNYVEWMNDSEKKVRVASFGAVKKYSGGGLPSIVDGTKEETIKYSPDDPEPKRAEAVAKVKSIIEDQMKKAPKEE